MPIKNLLKASLAGAALLALSFTGASAAPSIPCGTAKLIVPWGAGGKASTTSCQRWRSRW